VIGTLASVAVPKKARLTLLNPDATGLSGLLSKSLPSEDAEEVVENAAVEINPTKTNNATTRPRLPVGRNLLIIVLNEVGRDTRGCLMAFFPSILLGLLTGFNLVLLVSSVLFLGGFNFEVQHGYLF